MNKTIKSLLCLFLAFTMLLSFSACGGSNESAKTDTTEEADTTAQSDRMVYTAEFQPVSAFVDNGITALAYTDDGFYAQSWEKTGERARRHSPRCARRSR